jgi:hypothetical protein
MPSWCRKLGIRKLSRSKRANGYEKLPTQNEKSANKKESNEGESTEKVADKYSSTEDGSTEILTKNDALNEDTSQKGKATESLWDLFIRRVIHNKIHLPTLVKMQESIELLCAQSGLKIDSSKLPILEFESFLTIGRLLREVRKYTWRRQKTPQSIIDTRKRIEEYQCKLDIAMHFGYIRSRWHYYRFQQDVLPQQYGYNYGSYEPYVV